MAYLSGIGLGLTAASTLGNYYASKQETANYEEYQKAQTQATLHNYIVNARSLNNRLAQEQEAANQKTQDTYIKNLQAKATAQASAAASGVEGSTIDNLFAGYDRANAITSYTAARNLHLKRLQYQDDLEGLRANAISSINMQQQYVDKSASVMWGGLGNLMSDYSKNRRAGAKFNFFSGRGSSSKNKYTLNTLFSSTSTTGGYA